jgi:hypothetical protein
MNLKNDQGVLYLYVERFYTHLIFTLDVHTLFSRLATVLDFESRLTRLTELSELYQAREAIFLLPMTEYPQV